jgi:regulatory protein
MKSLDVEAARVVAFRFLGYAARTRNEIEQRLLRDEFAPELVTQVIAELEGKGYLDDAGFARHWVEDRADRKKYGRARLSAELNRKGIDRETAAEVLDNIEEAESLELLDMQALRKEKNRISGFLMRRGFSWQTIKKVLADMTENND